MTLISGKLNLMRSSSIEVSEEDGVRYLHFGSHWIQGAMRIARPWSLELEYTREMMLPLLLRSGATWPRTVLLVGLGAASLTRFLYRYRPRAAQTIIEIDPAVIAVAQQAFKLPPEGARLHIEINDGADYMIACDREFDLILVDGFDAQGRAGPLDTLPFYCNAQGRLSDRGLMAVNLLSRNQASRASVERLRAAFDGRVVALPACASGNVIALAAAGDRVDIAYEVLAKGARALRKETALNLSPTLVRLQHGRAGQPDRLKL